MSPWRQPNLASAAQTCNTFIKDYPLAGENLSTRQIAAQHTSVCLYACAMRREREGRERLLFFHTVYNVLINHGFKRHDDKPVKMYSA